MISAIQVDRKIERARLEDEIAKGLKGFEKAGRALSTIQDKKLYDEPTFEAYLKQRWGISRRYGERLIAAFKVVENLKETLEDGPIGRIPLPTSESQVRSLAGLPVEQQSVVWETAVKTSAREVPTSREVEAAITAVETESHWQPEQTVEVVAGADIGETVTVIESNPKKPIVICQTANGERKSYLNTQLEGHAKPTPVRVTAPPKAPPKEAPQIEAMSAKLSIESSRLQIIEESAARLVDAALGVVVAYPALKEESEFLSAIAATKKLIGS